MTSVRAAGQWLRLQYVPSTNTLYLAESVGTGTASWTTVGGAADHGALTGLADDDHPQYVTAAELAASGAVGAILISEHGTRRPSSSLTSCSPRMRTTSRTRKTAKEYRWPEARSAKPRYMDFTIRESADDGSDFTNPAADYRRLFLGEDGELHPKDSAGTVTDMPGAGSATAATDTIWDAAGDLAVGSGANTAAKLTKGAAGGALSIINAAVAWDSGTSSPAPQRPATATGASDLGQEFYFDGTRWAHTQIHSIQANGPTGNGLTANLLFSGAGFNSAGGSTSGSSATPARPPWTPRTTARSSGP